MEFYTSNTRGGPHFSIRGALLLVVLISLAPAVYLLLSTGARYSRHLEEQATAEALRQASAFAEIQLRITESTRQLLASLAALPAFRNSDFDHAEEVLRAVHAVNKDYLNLSLTDAQGRVVASSLLQRGTDLSERPHIRSALATKRFCTGEYVIGLIDSTPSFAYSYPLLDERGEPFAVINAPFTLSAYGRLFDSFALDKDSFLGIVDRKGVRLYFYPPRDTNPIGQAIQASVWRKIQDGPDTGTFLDTNADGSELFFGYKKLWLEGDSDPYITVVYAKPRDKATSVSRAITRRNMFALAAAALTSLTLAMVLSQLLFGRRLSRIGAMVARIQKGELDARVGLEGDGSDLGRIAQALDTMAEAVQKRDEERTDEARRLNRLLEEKEVLVKEVHHRVKNNLQMTLSLIRLQEGAPSRGEVSLKSLEARISSMAIVHEMLYSSGDLSDIDLGAYSSRLIGLLKDTYALDRSVSVECRCDAVYCTIEKAVPFGLLLNELVTNAFKYAIKETQGGEVSVSLRAENGMACLYVSDNGPGLPQDFDFGAPRGLGLQLVQALVGQLGGEISWKTGSGARFSVRFPLSVQGN